MTPKEKAIELTNKMAANLYKDAYYNAQKCALVAIDELLILYPSFVPPLRWEQEHNEYWLSVKKEIENL